MGNSGVQCAFDRATNTSWQTLKAVQKEFIAIPLAVTGGNKKEAALQLGISRRNNKLAKHRLTEQHL
ncbi:MAG TPA: helix-turn-helix domain-containing protein [Candidatus Udaeobacter sp.]|nr:helix-turn-helix domain-containing protein [Candidatus Udaeobacter sp.]